MSHLDTISRQGILASIRHGNLIWFDPQELITDEIRQLAREHKDDLIAEIKGLSENADPTVSEILPSYRFLWVATNLESFEECDPRYGYELGRDPVYRMLDAPYYAWLRHRMENVSKAHNGGRMSDDDYAVIRDRFNVVHTWAITHIGEENLRLAIRTTNIKRYMAPCDATVEAYHQSWAVARKANEARRRSILASGRSNEVRKLGHLLSIQGYAGIKSPIVDDIVIFIRDDSITVPAKWTSKIRFTMDELMLMIGSSVATVKQLYDIKQIFGGKVVPHYGGHPKVIGQSRSEHLRSATPVAQGSMF